MMLWLAGYNVHARPALDAAVGLVYAPGMPSWVLWLIAAAWVALILVVGLRALILTRRERPQVANPSLSRLAGSRS